MHSMRQNVSELMANLSILLVLEKQDDRLVTDHEQEIGSQGNNLLLQSDESEKRRIGRLGNAI